MKDATEISDNMLKNNYTIEVQALRSHSDTVSDVIGEYFYTGMSSKFLTPYATPSHLKSKATSYSISYNSHSCEI